MTLFTFVRHGETDWNKNHRFQGQSDVPLNARGREQAAALGRVIGGVPFDRAVSSDLSRALETARAICGEGVTVTDPRWREFAFGEWEGLTWERIVERWPDAAEQGLTAARSYAPPGGETFAEVRTRVGAALDELREGGFESVLVVTHAGPLHAMLHQVFGGEQAAQHELLGIRFVPASVTRIEFGADGPQLVSLNDVAHL